MNQQISSETIGKLAEALSKAQSTMSEAKEDAKNPFFKSNYADLTSVWRACRKSLTDNGLSISHTTMFMEQELVLVTTLLHSSGEWQRGYYPLMLAKRDAQSVGSAITYAKRYALAAIVGVCVEGEDDDAEKAMERKEMISPDQLRAIIKAVEADPESKDMILQRFKIAGFNQVPKESYSTVMTWLEGRAKEKANGKTRVA